MSKELTLNRHDFKVESFDNCLIDSLALAAEIVSPDYQFDPLLAFRALRKTSLYHLSNLFSLLERRGLDPTNYEVLNVYKHRESLFRVISQALESGAICGISVLGTPWIEQVLGLIDPHPDDTLHFITIYGYYQPNDHIFNGWLYIADSYQENKLFLAWERLFPLIFQEYGFVSLNLFGLCLDTHNLAEKHSCKTRNFHPQAQKAILRRVPIPENIFKKVPSPTKSASRRHCYNTNMATDRSYDDGIRITQEYLEGNETETEIDVELKYSPNFKGTASYNFKTDCIRFGNLLISQREKTGLVKAVLRHEKTHALFSHLELENQKRLLDGIIGAKQSWTALAEFMEIIFKHGAYDRSNFHPDGRITLAGKTNARERGHGYFYLPTLQIAIGEKEIDTVCITGILDELLAYANTKGSHDEVFFPKNDWAMYQAAQKCLDCLDPQTKQLIHDLGFDNISSSDLFEKFNQIIERDVPSKVLPAVTTLPRLFHLKE